MSKKLVETFYGKHYKFEVWRSSDLLSTEYWVYKDGSMYAGSYSSLSTAVDVARRAAGK